MGGNRYLREEVKNLPVMQMQQLLKWQVSEALYKLVYEDYSQDNSKLGGSHFNKLHRYIIKILLKNIALMYIHEDILYICIRREIVLSPHRNYASCYTHVKSIGEYVWLYIVWEALFSEE